MAPTLEKLVVLKDQNGWKIAATQNGSLTVELKYCKYTIEPSLTYKSAFFEKALTGGWKESVDKYIKLHDDDVHLFGRCIQFFVYGNYKPGDVFEYEQVITNDSGDIGYDDGSAPEPILSHLRKSYQRERHQIYGDGCSPKTEKQSDLLDDSAKSAACIDLQMYQIASKYCIAELQDLALKHFCQHIKPLHDRRARVSSASIHSVAIEAYTDLSLIDGRVKNELARYLARDWSAMRAGNRQVSCAIEDWLVKDPSLFLMLADHMGRF